MTDNRKFFLLWITLAVIFVAPHFSFFFFQAHSELGDFAANALEIRKAKLFHELYGNYSRWGFHHPGPIFFYAYAAGEYLLRDLLHAVPSPYNAHLITGIIIQTGFFAWTLLILRRRVAHALLIPLILIGGALHFGAVNYHIADSAFESIWPPYVLLFPFVCFLVACASLASGFAEEILPAVIAGGTLVHSHVAQCLFVLPFFLLACVALAIKSSCAEGSVLAPMREFPGRFAASGVALAVFLLPIFLDFLQGEQSNFRAILRHLSGHSDDHKTLLQSLAYLVTYFCYLAKPEEIFNIVGKPNFRFLAERWYFAAIWLLMIAVLIIAARSTSKSNRFVKWLYIYFGLGLGLTVCWGMLQKGEMYNYNSHFNFGLLFVAIILVMIAACAKISVQRSGSLPVILCLLALPLYIATARSWHPHIEFPKAAANLAQFDEMAEIAKGELSPTKFLSFSHDDWPWAAGVAIALERLNFDYATTPEWGFMFGSEHATNVATAIQQKHLAVWRFGARTENSRGFFVVKGGGPFVITSPPPINPAGSEITFAGPAANAGDYAVSGWDISNGKRAKKKNRKRSNPFSWSTSDTALLYFSPQLASNDIAVTLDIFPATFSKSKSQHVTVSFNNSLSQTYEVTSQQTITMRIPADTWNRESEAFLVFRFPDATSPLAAGVSADPRLISCGFTRIGFSEAKASQTH